MTAELVELSALVEDYDDATCEISVSLSWLKRVIWRRWCARPAAALVRITCPTCGPARKFICRTHLRVMRFKNPVCLTCGSQLVWVRPRGGDAL